LEQAHLANRYAVETECVVFNIEYRLSPEYHVFSAIESPANDAYRAVISISDLINEGKWEINPDRLAYFGAGGGAFIASSVGLYTATYETSHRFAF
jgi:acetyl esterase/lipase